MSQGVRVLKGRPLDLVVPEPVVIPHLDAGPFLPIEEGNIWIYAVHSHGYGPPSVDTLIWVPESEIIDGQQYWNLGWLGGPFRVDDRGDLWYRQNAETRDVISRFLARLDAEPQLRTADFYQKSRIFSGLSADSADLLVVEFDGPDVEGESPTAELDQRLYGEYTWALQGALPMGIEKRGSPAADQRAFSFICCGTEWGARVIFQRGIGVVEMTSGSALTSGQADTKLIWARIGGREYGRHPGEGYPGYPTSVERASWGQVKRSGTERPPAAGAGPPARR